MKTFFPVLMALLSALPFAVDARAFTNTLTAFSQLNYERAQDRSERFDLPLPQPAHDFFEAAIAGDWPIITNRFSALMQSDDGHFAMEGLRNELWAPILETFGIHEVWADWQQDAALLSMFYNPILAVLPTNSIYFGGTDHGRFVITAVTALRQSPAPFCITQNALADNTYMAALRDRYGDRLWIPSPDDSNRAFQQYVTDIQEGRIPAGAEVEVNDGRVSVKGVQGVMMINGLLARLIVEANQDDHDIFVEESYVIDWMYPYLEPRGLIMKLHPAPLAELSADTIEHDRAFWRDQEDALFAYPGFTDNTAARKAFAKLRSAIAGLYAYRHLHDEAEAAFRQAIRLHPASPEPYFRLAELLVAQDRVPAAQEIMASFIPLAPHHVQQRAIDYLNQLKQMEANSPADDEAHTVHSIDGRTFTTDTVHNDGERLQFRSGSWDYNLPAYFLTDEAVDDPVPVTTIVIDAETIIGPDGPLVSFNEMAAYLDEQAAPGSPVLIELVDPVDWDEYRRLRFGTAYGAMDERPHVGIQGAWPFRPYAQE